MNAAIQRLDQDQLGRCIEDALQEFLPRAEELVCQHFCSDCDRTYKCLSMFDFCPNARVMTKIYLNAITREKAIWN